MVRIMSKPDQRYFLERHIPTRLKLMRWLAENRDHKSIAADVNCSVDGVRRFEMRHRDEINEIRQNMTDEFAGILYVKKEQRLAAYAQTIEDAGRLIDSLISAGRVVKLDDEEGTEIGSGDISDAIARYERGRHRALRSIAEELGHLPSRMALVIEDSKLRHELVGVDPEKDL